LLPQYIAVFPFSERPLDTNGRFNKAFGERRKQLKRRHVTMMKLIESGRDRGSIVSDIAFALITSIVSGCLGGLALILLMLAATGNDF
jgi:hypothetical protein